MIRRIKRTRRGTWELRLPDEERVVLRSLGPQLRALLTHGSGDADLRRLFPSAYPDDPDADSFYRLLSHDELLTKRLANLDLFEEALDAKELTEIQLNGLMGAVNDLRLVLGTKLDVSEEQLPDEIDDDDPDGPAFAIYSYLGWILELVVDALFDTVPEEGIED